MAKNIEADIVKRWKSCQVEFEHEEKRFAAHHGYKQRDTVQIRLEDNGDIYLSDYSDIRYPNRIISVSIPFNIFIKEFPQFIEHLQAVKELSQPIEQEVK